MKESMWGYMVIVMGILAISIIFFFQNVTNTEESNYTVLKETTQAAMYDSIDYATYRKTGDVKIIKEKFVENFVRRFAESASLSHTYKIDIYDVNETPPKVSLKISTADDKLNVNDGEIVTFTVTDKIDAIIENK